MPFCHMPENGCCRRSEDDREAGLSQTWTAYEDHTNERDRKRNSAHDECVPDRCAEEMPEGNTRVATLGFNQSEQPDPGSDPSDTSKRWRAREVASDEELYRCDAKQKEQARVEQPPR